MKILSVLSQKGGVGKTTLATCLAVAAEQDGQKTVILDIDPQATASFWHDIREAETPNVMSVQVSRLEHTLKSAEQSGVDLIIIDGAAVARDLAYEAAKFSDHILIPTKAAVFDTASMMHTVDIVSGQGKDCSIILTFVPPVGHEIEEAINWLAGMELDICPVLIGNRKDYYRAQVTGLAVQEFNVSSKAAEEINKLYQFIMTKFFKEGKYND
jgi:chromosome partitioning protein